MKEDKIVMSQKELQRVGVLDRVAAGDIPLREGARLMGVSYRQAKRLKAAFLSSGPPGLCHGNRGRASPRAISESIRVQVESLSKGRYADCNDTHFTELLAEKEGLVLGRETVRRIRRAAGIAPKRKRRPKRHHKRRPRMELPGAMMLWDGSPHSWFGQDRPPCCLMASVDDATSRILWGRFEEAETSLAYLRLLDGVIRTHGVPASVYQDRHGALFRNDDQWTLEEQLAGKQTPTQVGRVLEDFGIEAIRALSPQAKGRVERLFGTLQDRMIAEMKLDGIDTIEKANAWLAGYIERHNKRFAVPAEKSGTLFRKPGRMDLDKLLSFRYEATVGNDNAVRIGGLVIDVPPGPSGRGYAKAKVDVRQLLDGSWRVYYQGKRIADHAPTELRSPLKSHKRRHAKGARNWTWVYLESAPAHP
jgi:transposase